MQQRQTSDELFVAGMVLSMTCWGFSWTSGKILAQYGDPITISFIRFAVTVGSLVIIIFFLKDKFLVHRSGIRDLLGGALLLSLYTFFFFKGLVTGKAGAGGVLVTVLNPIVAYGITIAIEKRAPTRNEWLGLLLGSLAGVILLKVLTEPDQIMAAGNLYFFLAAVTWALLSRFTARAKKYGSSISFSLWLYSISSIMLLVVAGVQPSIDVIERSDGLFWWNLFFSATITTALATTFYFVATTRVGASRASSFIFLVPFSAALGAWIFLGEKVEVQTVIGGVLGIIAVYVLNRKASNQSS